MTRSRDLDEAARRLAERRVAEETHVRKLADALAEAGYRVEVVATARGWVALVTVPWQPEVVTVRADLAADPGRYVWTPWLPPFGTVDDLPGSVAEIRAVVGPPTDVGIG